MHGEITRSSPHFQRMPPLRPIRTINADHRVFYHARPGHQNLTTAAVALTGIGSLCAPKYAGQSPCAAVGGQLEWVVMRLASSSFPQFRQNGTLVANCGRPSRARFVVPGPGCRYIRVLLPSSALEAQDMASRPWVRGACVGPGTETECFFVAESLTASWSGCVFTYGRAALFHVRSNIFPNAFCG
jgi:hypothetical protein